MQKPLPPYRINRLVISNSLKRIAFFSLFFTIFLLSFSSNGNAQSLPSGFSQVMVANGISNPTVMAFAPDGRIFVAQQNGQLRIIKNGTLLQQPFVSLSVNSSGERGLLGIAFDPNFFSNQYVYLYYTLSSGSNNRISRFTANGDVAVQGSEQVILNLDPLSGATNHNGGTMQFGPDGKLYVGVGENADAANSQRTDTYHGKILRINPDGSVPSGNPFTSGNNQQMRIWSYGVRNPYTIAFQPGTGKLYVNDVGASSWEEINDATSGGKNFGWPQTEGNGSSSYSNPVYAYGHGGGVGNGCAITGGTFFNPSSTNYPSTYNGRYFFLDFCNNWIDMLSSGGSRSNFASNIAGSAVSLVTGTDGNLYFLSRDNSAVYKIVYAGGSSAPTITNQPQSTTVAQGNSVTFSVSATGNGPLSYQWRKNGVNINGATNSSFTISNVTTSTAGNYSVVVTNSGGSVTSNNATLTVTSPNQPPVANISTPAAGTTYAGGQTINFSGSASDPEDGTLGGGSFTWYVIFHHDSHTHPGPSATTAATSGSFTIPNAGETASNVFYRLYLVVTDPDGARDTTYRDIMPRTSTITLNTNPQGLQITLDGQPFTAPLTVTSVEGILRTIGTSSTQTQNSVTYNFNNWSHGGAQTQTLATPVNNTTYTANFTAATIAPAITSQPRSITVETGSNALFSVTASGTAPLSYQWRRNGTNISGANSSSYNISSVTAANAGNYSVVVSNSAGTVTSNNATLTVTSSPGITNQPQNLTVAQGASASFSVTASGTGPLSYQWRRNGTNIDGANSSTYSISSTTAASAGTYSVVVSNDYGTTTSNNATLTVTSSPVITNQPQSMTVAQGASASFSVTASGTGPLSYQWRRNGSNINGANNSTYTISSATNANAGTYSVVVSNNYGTASSNNATLTVTSLPVITSQPQSITVAQGSPASFNVTATGTAPLSYQWRRNGSNINGANSATYNISSATTANAGTYSVVVTNAYGNAISNSATLTVTSVPVITSQPQSIIVTQGNAASFSVSATGTGPLSYQWRKNGVTISGATSSTYTIPSVSSSDGADYSVVVTNPYGQATSNNTTLTVTFAPVITSQPQGASITQGNPATFRVTAAGTGPLTYQWRKNGINIDDAVSSVYTITSVVSSDAGNYSVVVSNNYGTATSNNATLAVTTLSNEAPVANITSPAQGTKYAGGEVINYSGTGTDAEDGTLTPSAFEWFVTFYHGDHAHAGPILASGADSGAFTIPNDNETATDVFYRLTLVVTDQGGVKDTAVRDIYPRTTDITFNTSPQGLTISLDGELLTTPATITSVEGILRTISVPSPQAIDTVNYYFNSWSQGGLQTQTITTPVDDASYTAVFETQQAPGSDSLRNPDNPSNIANDLDYSYYHGTWNRLPDMSTLYKQKVGTVPNFVLSPRTETSNYAFMFKGFISVPADGYYTFYTSSDEGSRLYIGDSLIVDNDSLHAEQERSGTIGLKAGLHQITVTYFEKTGDDKLSVSYESATIEKQPVPDSVLFREQPVQYVFNPTADAYVRSGTYMNVNIYRGTTPELITSGNGESEDEYHTYLRFDISSLPTDISSARLRLFGGLNSPNFAPVAIEVYNVPNYSWLENTISYANKPSAEPTMLASTVVSGSDAQYYEWDLTQHLLDLRKAGVYYVSFLVKNDPATGDHLVTFNSRENENNKPELLINTARLITQASRGVQSNTPVAVTKKATIDSEDGISLSIYPNPVVNSFTVQYSPELRSKKLHITDMNGKLLKQVNLTGERTQLVRVDGFKGGLYFVTVEGKNRKYTQKIMIRN